MNSTSEFHSVIIENEVLWTGLTGHEGAIENVTIAPTIAVDAFSVTAGQEGILNISNCLIDETPHNNRCVNWNTTNPSTIKLNNCLLREGTLEFILIDGAANVSLDNCTLSGDNSINGIDLRGTATHVINNCSIDGRLITLGSVSVNCFNTRIDCLGITVLQAVRVRAITTVTLDNCTVLSNNRPCVIINDNATCIILGGTLNSNSPGGFVIQNLGGVGTSILNKASIIMQGSNSTIDPLIVVTTYVVS